MLSVHRCVVVHVCERCQCIDVSVYRYVRDVCIYMYWYSLCTGVYVLSMYRCASVLKCAGVTRKHHLTIFYSILQSSSTTQPCWKPASQHTHSSYHSITPMTASYPVAMLTHLKAPIVSPCLPPHENC